MKIDVLYQDNPYVTITLSGEIADSNTKAIVSDIQLLTESPVAKYVYYSLFAVTLPYGGGLSNNDDEFHGIHSYNELTLLIKMLPEGFALRPQSPIAIVPIPHFPNNGIIRH